MRNNQLMDKLQRADDVRCSGLKLVERNQSSYFVAAGQQDTFEKCVCRIESSKPQLGRNCAGAKKAVIDIHSLHGENRVGINARAQINVYSAADHKEFEPLPVKDSVGYRKRIGRDSQELVLGQFCCECQIRAAPVQKDQTLRLN